MKRSLVSVVFCLAVIVALPTYCRGEIDFSTTPDRLIGGNIPAGVAWGDIDGNGWLDLVIGNGADAAFAPDNLYFNFNGHLSLTPGWKSEYSGASCMTMLGDLDNDGDLDMVVPSLGIFGSYVPQAQVIYYNNSGLPPSPDWYSVPMNAFCGALGDPDGDGDLDIVFADGGGGFFSKTLKMFYNNGGVFNTEEDWRSDQVYNTIDASFADIDLDGDLDLVTCCLAGYIHVFYNNSGVLETTPSWNSSKIPVINGLPYLDLGDIDGDGFPDLAVAGGLSGYLFFRNLGGTLESTPSWRCYSYIASSVAWADADDDGDLDLAGCGWLGAPVGIFENVDGILSGSFVWSAPVSDNSFQVAWADYDEDMLVEDVKNIIADGTRKLFLLDKKPIHKIISVNINGVPLDYNQYCALDIDGWVSLGSPPEAGSQVSIHYEYSRDLDLAVGNDIARIFNNKLSTNYFPTYTFTSTEFVDDNGDGFFDAGETARFYFYLNNEHAADHDVTITMTSSSPDIVFINPSVFFPVIEGGNTTVNNLSDPIEYIIPDIEDAVFDTFFLTIESSLGTYRDQFQYIHETGRAEILLIDDDAGENSEDIYYNDLYDMNIPSHIWTTGMRGSPTGEDLRQYRIAFWFTGAEAPDCIQADDVSAMKDYLDDGGNLFLSGLGLAGELSVENPTFLQNYLHCTYSQDRSYYIHDGLAGSLFDGLQLRLIAMEAPGMEKINMANGGQATLKFGNTSSSYSAVSHSGYYRMLFITYGYELISRDYTGEGYASREEVLQRILAFFPKYICGDANNDETVNILDIVYLINYKYKAGPIPEPPTSGDVNSDGSVNILDIVYLINYKYKGGPAPDCP